MTTIEHGLHGMNDGLPWQWRSIDNRRAIPQPQGDGAVAMKRTSNEDI